MKFIKFIFLMGSLVFALSCKDNLDKIIENKAESITVSVPDSLSSEGSEYYDFLFSQLYDLVSENEGQKEYFEVLVKSDNQVNMRRYVGYNKLYKRVYVDPSASCYGTYIFSNVELDQMRVNGAFSPSTHTSDVFGEEDSTLLLGNAKFRDIGIYHSRCKAFGY